MSSWEKKYKLLKPLEKGGIGEAFLVSDTLKPEIQWVLKKVPKRAFREKIDSLRREFVTLSRLAHPNIVRVLEFGEDEEAFFFIEDYVEGNDLFQATSQANYNQIFVSLVQILRALDYLHHQGIIHGDLKGENILVVKGASLFSEDAVKLIDFGLAKNVREIQPNTLPFGTLHFIAPEILLRKAFDHRADLYALGVCLYRMLAGRFPFEEERGNIDGLVEAQLKKMPPPLEGFRADLPKGLSEITLRLLQKSPSDRFRSATEVLHFLNESEGEGFPLWTPTELRLSLQEGPFIGREKELKDLWHLYSKGERKFVLAGEAGIGKSRLAREFRLQLQVEGEEDEGVVVEESDFNRNLVGVGLVPTFFKEQPPFVHDQEGQPQGIAPTGCDSQEIPLSPWTPMDMESFIKNRLRLNEIPDSWAFRLEDLTKGNPQKLITLVECWFAEDVVKMEKDKIRFRETPAWTSHDFQKALKRQRTSLEETKKKLLQLLAFAQTPLSFELLKRMTGMEGALLQSHLDSLEKEHWLERVLFQGTFHFRMEPQKAKDFLTSIPKEGDLDSLLGLIDETLHSGEPLRARNILEALLGQIEEKNLSRDQKAHLYTLASRIFFETGEMDQVRTWSDKFLTLPDLREDERGKIFNRLGLMEYRQGHYSKALDFFDQSRVAWEKTQDPRGQSSVANFFGMTYQALGDLEKALGWYQKALSLLPEGDAWRPRFRMNLGLAAQQREEFEEAISILEKAREEAETGKDHQIEAQILGNLSNLFLYLGRLDRAGAIAHASLKTALENGLSYLEAQNYLLLSMIADKEGNFDDARDLIEKALPLFDRYGGVTERGRVRLYQAYNFFSKKDIVSALNLIASLRHSFPTEKEILDQCDLLEGKIAAERDPPEVSEGEASLKSLFDFYESKGDLANLWDVAFTLGKLYRREKPDQARRLFRRGLEILEKLAEKIPEAYRSGFFRDRKREEILAELSALNLNSLSPSPRPSPVKGEGGAVLGVSENRDTPFPSMGEGPIGEQPMKQEAFVEMARIARLLASQQNLNYLLETILQESLDLLEAERGFVLLLENGEFQIRLSRNIEKKALEGEEERYSTTVARQAAVKARSILVRHAQVDDQFREAESVIALKLGAILAVPMKIGPEVIGVIYVDNRVRQGSFDEPHQKLLEAFADQAALAIRNARQMDEIRKREKEVEESKGKIEQLNELLRDRLDRTEQEYAEMQERYRLQQEELHLRYSYDQIIGRSAKLQEVLKILDRVTDSEVTVLVTGESGTGKELIARALHYNGPRQKAPFVAENCAAFSETLLESELFGHLRGSFTGAETDRKGIFEVASGGTVFLDEIGEMPLGMQAKLLRVLQERQIRPIGGQTYKKVNVRIIAATNQNLEKLVEEGKFRRDLFYRVNVVRVKLPALRERTEDIPPLVEHFLTKYSEETGLPIRVSPKTMDLLVRHDWPGNIRELANEIQRAATLAEKGVIQPELLSEAIRQRKVPVVTSLDEQVTKTEKVVIQETLKKFRFSRSKTAKALGLGRTTLYKKMKEYGLLQ